jgi:aspartyl-tRNA(Asn)/glutamyl-tRNA(Gln) amidotransferase subunit A
MAHPETRLHPLPNETIAGVAQAILDRRRNCLEVVEDCLARIDDLEPRIHAWVSVDRSGARARAQELDRELATGRWRGPLHGIPIGIKDLVDVAGWPTAAGASWLKDAVVWKDAPLVTRLREAGAIVLGKTVTTHFACFDPPVTRNPWNLERTPGGSSSGSAAAVATGMCLGAIGTQTGGSITRPASFCGVAGCKPTYGLVPLEGVYPFSKSLDHGGPIARSVEDLGIILNEIASPSQYSTSRERHSEASAIESAVKSPFAAANNVRLGRLGGMFQSQAEPRALKKFDSALKHLEHAGAVIRDVALPPEFDDVLVHHRTIISREIADHHRPFFAQHLEEYLPAVRSLIEHGLQVSDIAYANANAHQRKLMTSVVDAMGAVDALVCPAAVGPAPGPETTGDPSFNAPWSYTRQPTVSFPYDLSDDGLPLAIQLVGRHNAEPALFGVALWCERAIRL